ncbi:ECF RNA polymerase sigma factor SigE [Gemmata obscuriglobus]|uniref:RNA polymerase sigma factor n=1 Tax=Gemmata obscuriglobus TaxID=114 RepID=UPI00016C4345|nr:sigma-70 family RNA polymerase sigma factor [Gemmata obscuriglobus]QEG31492.1 ECF RNA polymerase sigma factor SigE [Gemmata obscuriglobus]VTS10834.1 sigma-70 family rna polymerase sigma factor : RNA polymerase sigma factor, sigma-70 family OS=Singulisphaera acidiphila (strain ATCC BAA-1392 / DSM 18658 / VKM B-2454 / MOB10) GN=Sinac_6419 PE=4 SV=1: Sigma70_r2: Sigma70_r4_2 [Gemmata obscuriglobus UQM 2246]
MPTEARPLTRQLLRVVLGTPDVPDRDLLARFVNARDEDAFAELVRRHGAMVLAVCRRVTGRAHDAEDAFQAAFLVLAKRAGHLSRPELLANWLYGVAFRTALDARAARRRAEDRVVPTAAEPACPEPPDDNAELRRVIDEELARLPDKYRAAVVLCDLEGLPRSAAARALGVPEGTLSSRLAHARKLLAGRLTRRGVTASVAAAGAVLTRDAAATVVPHNLTHTTVQLAARFALARGTVPPGAPPEVSSLTEGALKAMLVTRLKQTFAAGLFACGLIGVGGALAQQLGAPAVKTAPAAPEQPLVAEDAPFVAQPTKKLPEAKKIVAKGIEDDDVPYGTFPSQAVVRIEDGKLVRRNRVGGAELVKQVVGDQTILGYQMTSSVQATAYDPADIAVFDIKGNRLSPKAWKEMLKTDVVALISSNGSLPNPRELTMFKPDTLVIVLPTGYAQHSAGGATSYFPTYGGQMLPTPPTLAVPSSPFGNTVPAAPAPNTRPATPAAPRATMPPKAQPALPPPPSTGSDPFAAPPVTRGQDVPPLAPIPDSQ